MRDQQDDEDAASWPAFVTAMGICPATGLKPGLWPARRVFELAGGPPPDNCLSPTIRGWPTDLWAAGDQPYAAVMHLLGFARGKFDLWPEQFRDPAGAIAFPVLPRGRGLEACRDGRSRPASYQPRSVPCLSRWPCQA